MAKQQASKTLEAELHEGEELLWVGAPKRLPIFTILFGGFYLSIFVAAFILPVGYALLTDDMTIFQSYDLTINGVLVDENTAKSSLVWVFVPIAIMIALFCVIFAHFIFSRMSECYGITRNRAIIVKHYFGKKVISVNFRCTQRLVRRGNSQFGTLSFFRADIGWYEKLLNLYAVTNSSFMNIADPKQVEGLAMRAMNATESTTQ